MDLGAKTVSEENHLSRIATLLLIATTALAGCAAAPRPFDAGIPTPVEVPPTLPKPGAPAVADAGTAAPSRLNSSLLPGMFRRGGWGRVVALDRCDAGEVLVWSRFNASSRFSPLMLHVQEPEPVQECLPVSKDLRQALLLGQDVRLGEDASGQFQVLDIQEFQRLSPRGTP